MDHEPDRTTSPRSPTRIKAASDEPAEVVDELAYGHRAATQGHGRRVAGAAGIAVAGLGVYPDLCKDGRTPVGERPVTGPRRSEQQDPPSIDRRPHAKKLGDRH